MPNIVRPTAAFKNNKKLNKIYNDIKTKGLFKFYLQKFEPKFSVAHLLFDYKKLEDEDSDKLAVTNSPENYWIKIEFNKNLDWDNIPNIVIADTFMHEMIHAEIFRKLLSEVSINGKINVDKIKLMINEKNYPGLFDYYVQNVRGSQSQQHEMMAASYVKVMVGFLKELYGNEYSNEEYETVVWLGLKDTIAWNRLGKAKQDEYQRIWNEKYWQWEK